MTQLLRYETANNFGNAPSATVQVPFGNALRYSAAADTVYVGLQQGGTTAIPAFSSLSGATTPATRTLAAGAPVSDLILDDTR